jgi:hypothetical protein
MYELRNGICCADDMLTPRRVIFSTITLIPGVASLPPVARILVEKAKGTGGSVSPEYCYSVWLRHLVTAAGCGLNGHPRIVAELGPGDSLGVGLAALLSGAERYFALDVVEHASAAHNIAVLDALVELFRTRAPIPDDAVFPHVVPRLPNYSFPHHLLTDDRLSKALAPERVERIRASLRDCSSPGSLVTYRAPWHSAHVIENGSVDMLFSQAVLEHVDALSETYHAMHAWLAPGGYVSHTVDFKCHGFANEWNGHWRYSDLFWKFVRGKAVWSINREPWSTHVGCLENSGFKLVKVQVSRRESTLDPTRVAKRYRAAPASDFTISDATYQAVKQRA